MKVNIFEFINDDKIKKIDPLYLPAARRVDLSDETPINTSKDSKQSIAFPPDFGTISEFYFLFFEMVHFSLIHITRKCEEIRNLVDRYKEERK